MFIAIVRHTPLFVWALLAALVALGLSQARTRQMTLARVTVLPLVMVGLSLAGVLGAFGHGALPLGAWSGGLGAALLAARPLLEVRGAAWSASTQRLRVPGSWLPLALILTLFCLKYGAGVSLALHPSLGTDPLFATSCSLAYGVFSGLFLARGLALRSVATRLRDGVLGGA